ncbi:hypothetical protein ElyMa_001965800 [Elysia marginata]|uniref:SMB domain-containing protein n=1 Tax=Elysia marginata TaxID=1093978 RepID=A0AAV4EZ95_9GAST|nr:hypothetical protein ElyMa_001965800 [Elysia marginata]
MSLLLATRVFYSFYLLSTVASQGRESGPEQDIPQIASLQFPTSTSTTKSPEVNAQTMVGLGGIGVPGPPAPQTIPAPQSIPMKNFATPSFVSEPPWYLNPSSNVNETFVMTNLSQSGTVGFEVMLEKLKQHTEQKGFQKWIMSIGMGWHSLEWTTTLEMDEMILEHNLCYQEAFGNRTSCSGRCGQPPDVWETPGQCGCDDECFLFGDCCEDLHTVCPPVFVEAVKTFYFRIDSFSAPSCVHYEDEILSYLFHPQLTNTVEPYLFEVYCDFERFKAHANKDIFDALYDGHCKSGVISSNKRASSSRRHCGRPDVLVCDNDEEPDLYSVFPLHLQCYDHPLTEGIVNRFDVGLGGMETISIHEDCRHLRLPPELNKTRLGHESISNVPQLSKPDILKVKVTPSPDRIDAQFLHHALGVLKCSAYSRKKWTCKTFQCPDNHLVDKESQTCYKPDEAHLRVSQLRSGPTEHNVHDDVSSASTTQVSPCLCLKFHLNMITLSWWTILVDTAALANGLCRLKISNSLGREKSNSQNGELSRNELEAIVKGLFNKSRGGGERNISDLTEARALGESFSGDGDSDTGHYAVKENETLFVSNYFSDFFLQIWQNSMYHCAEEKSSGISACFFQRESTQHYKTCFLVKPQTRRPLRISESETSPFIEQSARATCLMCGSVPAVKLSLSLFVFKIYDFLKEF